MSYINAQDVQKGEAFRDRAGTLFSATYGARQVQENPETDPRIIIGVEELSGARTYRSFDVDEPVVLG